MVIEVLLGIVIGPHPLGLVHYDAVLSTMHTFGMAATLFMAGCARFQPHQRTATRAGRQWLGAIRGDWNGRRATSYRPYGARADDGHAGPLHHRTRHPDPDLSRRRQLKTTFGRFILAAGTIGEVGPIVAMSLLLSAALHTWQEAGFLVVFLAIVGVATAVGAGARPPRVIAFLGRQMHASSQLPVRISLLMLAAMFVLAQEFGFESILGAFAAGMIVGLATRGDDGKSMREKIDAVSFGWFYPFFFVGTGVKFDITALGKDLTTVLLVPTFVILFLVIRGASALLYRNEITKTERLSFAFCPPCLRSR